MKIHVDAVTVASQVAGPALDLPNLADTRKRVFRISSAKNRIGLRSAMDDSTLIAGGAIATALLTEAGKKLITPLAEQLGLALGDLGSIYRRYQHENLGKIFTKWAESERAGKGLDAEEFKRIMPLLPLAAQVSDDDLQDRWAALLESAAKGDEGFLPSFGQTLSQLTVEEAKFLDRLLEDVSKPKTYSSQYSFLREPMDRSALIRIYDPSIEAWMNPAERRMFQGRLTKEQVENFAKVDRADLIIQDLERVGILVQEQIAEPDAYITIPHSVAGHDVDSSVAGKKIPLHRSQTVIRSLYSLSPYGLTFLQSVTPRKTANKEPE